MAVLISKGNLDTRLGLGCTQVSGSPHSANLKSLYRGLHWVQSRRPRRCSQHIAISRPCPWSSCWKQGSTWNPHSENRDGGIEETLSARPGSAHRSPGGHVLSMTFPNTDARVTSQFECGKYKTGEGGVRILPRPGTKNFKMFALDLFFLIVTIQKATFPL